MREIEDTIIAHYQLERLLARGGMSNVYLAHDTHTGHIVAIKLVNNSESDYCERFKREAKVIASLTHDHILPPFDYGEQGSWCYMIMPYIEYGTLRNRLIDGPLSPKEAGKIFTQLADAIQFAHDRGIVHRDIKPSNILLRDGEHVYLADFGLVRHVEEMSDITSTGLLLGTPEYMAPELTESPATPGSDIYALGIVLYQMLTGRVPFKSSSPIGVCWKHLRERPVAPSTLNPSISPATDKVILQALEKNPQHRFRSANDFAQAYQRSLKQVEQRGAIEASVPQIRIPHDNALAATLYSSKASTVSQHPPTIRTRSWQRSLRQIKKVHIGALAVFALLLLFILPTMLGFSFSLFYGRAQQPTFLGAGGSFISAHISIEPPIVQPTPTAGDTPNTPTPSTTTHSRNTYQPPAYFSQNNSGYSGGNGSRSGGNGDSHGGNGGSGSNGHGHGHKHKHGHGDD